MMSRNEILKTLVTEYYLCRKSAQDCSRLGHPQLSEQANHQALGISTAIESLGFSHAEVKAEYLVVVKEFQVTTV